VPTRRFARCQVLNPTATDPHNCIMRTNSRLFDRIRVKPEHDRRLAPDLPGCQWPGCTGSATHRAPKGRLRGSEYWQFCLEHVREYNNSYNFFAGMSEDAITKYQKEALTGHRPTWKMGSIGGKRTRGATTGFRNGDWSAEDPFSLFEEWGPRRGGHARTAPEGRKIFNAQRRALDVLGLEPDAKRADIKSKFKLLVKRHHPDANGGDRGSEARLREIIQAYNYLKSAGFC
jgi:DnaJ domain